MIHGGIDRSQCSVIGLEEHVLVRPVLTELRPDANVADQNLSCNGRRLKFLNRICSETAPVIEPFVAPVDTQLIQKLQLRVSGNSLPFHLVELVNMITSQHPVTRQPEALVQIEV